MKKRTLSLGLRELEYLADAVEAARERDEDGARESTGAQRRLLLLEAELGSGLLRRLRRGTDDAADDAGYDGDPGDEA